MSTSDTIFFAALVLPIVVVGTYFLWAGVVQGLINRSLYVIFKNQVEVGRAAQGWGLAYALIGIYLLASITVTLTENIVGQR